MYTILSVYESATPFTSTSSPPMALSKSNDLCHTAKVEDKTYEDRREQRTRCRPSLIEKGNVKVGLDDKTRKQLDILCSKEQNCSGASRQCYKSRGPNS